MKHDFGVLRDGILNGFHLLSDGFLSEISPHVVRIFPVRVVLCLHVMNPIHHHKRTSSIAADRVSRGLVAKGLCVEMVGCFVGDTDVKRRVFGIEDLGHGTI